MWVKPGGSLSGKKKHFFPFNFSLFSWHDIIYSEAPAPAPVPAPAHATAPALAPNPFAAAPVTGEFL